MTSRTIRHNYKIRPTPCNSKLNINEISITRHYSQLGKIRNTWLKNLALRLHHNDIFTKSKLYRRGLIEDDTCDKCNNREDIDHLLIQCWYSGRIWNRLIELYKLTDTRPRTYLCNLDFILDTDNNLSAPKMILHLENIGRLTQKDWPRLLPRTIIKHAIENLLICETNFRHKQVYKKLLEALNNW